jgi:outer membrane protein assembly factor BamD
MAHAASLGAFGGVTSGTTGRLAGSVRTGVVRLAVIVAVALSVTGCASRTSRRAVPPGTSRPDQYLLERGQEALKDRKWLVAREFFKLVNETYTQSPLRPDAKLGVGDTYLGEGSAESLVLAIAEFQEFLSFYPTHGRADYAQYKLGMAHFLQMRSPQRDQSETREAIRDFETFVARYPNSELMPEVQARMRESKDRLAESDYLVGVFYYRQQWYPGTIDRLSVLLKSDPEYSRRDGAYYYLGEALLKVKRQAEALPYFQRLVNEFEKSEYLEQAKRRVEEISTALQAAPGAASPAATSKEPASPASPSAPGTKDPA